MSIIHKLLFQFWLSHKYWYPSNLLSDEFEKVVYKTNYDPMQIVEIKQRQLPFPYTHLTVCERKLGFFSAEKLSIKIQSKIAANGAHQMKLMNFGLKL